MQREEYEATKRANGKNSDDDEPSEGIAYLTPQKKTEPEVLAYKTPNEEKKQMPRPPPKAKAY